MLDPKTIAAITHQVQARFPEVANCLPKVRLQASQKSASQQAAQPGSGLTRYLVTYRSQATLSANEKIERLIRVVVDARGKILKITTSR